MSFSTVLFVNGQPVGYAVQPDGAGYLLQPAPDSGAPVVHLQPPASGWTSTPTLEQHEIDLVLQGIEANVDKLQAAI